MLTTQASEKFDLAFQPFTVLVDPNKLRYENMSHLLHVEAMLTDSFSWYHVLLAAPELGSFASCPAWHLYGSVLYPALSSAAPSCFASC